MNEARERALWRALDESVEAILSAGVSARAPFQDVADEVQRRVAAVLSEWGTEDDEPDAA